MNNFSFTRVLILFFTISIGVIVLALFKYFGIDTTFSPIAMIIIISMVFVCAFLYWNRGKNIALVRALIGIDPMIVQHADGTFSGSCPSCRSKFKSMSVPGPPFEIVCQECHAAVRFPGTHPAA